MSNTIGRQIRRLRRDKGITQAALADAVNVSVQAVSKWECGGTPDINLMPAIAGFFGVSIDTLFGFKSANETKVDTLVQQEIWRTPKGRRMQRACELGFAALKGLTGIPNIIDVGYGDTCDTLENDCTRCRIMFDDGIAYGSADRMAPSVFLLPEPEKGYREQMFPVNDYVELFNLFSEDGMMQVLLYLYSRRAIPFSMQHIVSALKLDESTIVTCLERIKVFRWIEEEEVEIESGTILLYRPVLSEAFVAFMYFASELLRKPRLWYLSNVSREMPFLR